MIRLKRVYDPPSKHDGVRLLVERLWPRGVRKEELPIEAWCKEAAPSPRLRTWFAHDPAKWEKFEQKYFLELDSRPEAWTPIWKRAKNRTVTLIYSSRDAEHNNAVALKHYLDRKLAHAGRRRTGAVVP